MDRKGPGESEPQWTVEWGPSITIRESIRSQGWVTAVILLGSEPGSGPKVGQLTVPEEEWPRVADLLAAGRADVFRAYPDRPLMLLDVDGVLNHIGEPEEGDGSFAHAKGVRAPAGIEQAVRALAGAFEVWWCTAWEWNANLLLCDPWGIRRFDWVRVSGLVAEAPGWKWIAVQAWLRSYAAGRPTVWVDDEVGGGLPSATRSELQDHPNLMLRPIDNRRGLRHSDVVQLLAWAQEVTGESHG